MELSLSLLPLLVAISSQHKTDSPFKKSPCFSRERYSMLRVFLYTLWAWSRLFPFSLSVHIGVGVADCSAFAVLVFQGSHHGCSC